MNFSRIQSPSSINTFLQCPRKYYFRYILEIEAPSSIAQVRGKVVHSVLETFYDLKPTGLTPENCSAALCAAAQELLITEWKAEPTISQLVPNQEERYRVFEETLHMVTQWVQQTVVPRLLALPGNPSTNFPLIVPEREQHYKSSTIGVQGYIDAIEKHADDIHIMDYKTSSSFDVEEHALQLGIYSLLYHEKHGKLPTKVGIYYLKNASAKHLPVTPYLLEDAHKKIQYVHKSTQTTAVEHYPLKPSRLCKWSTGQCEYHDYCFKGKRLPEASVFKKDLRAQAPSSAQQISMKDATTNNQNTTNLNAPLTLTQSPISTPTTYCALTGFTEQPPLTTAAQDATQPQTSPPPSQ